MPKKAYIRGGARTCVPVRGAGMSVVYCAASLSPVRSVDSLVVWLKVPRNIPGEKGDMGGDEQLNDQLGLDS